MPQLPTTYALVKQVSVDSITEDTDNLIKKNGDYAYVWNDTAASRIKLCLKLMLEQGYISPVSYTHLDVYKRQIQYLLVSVFYILSNTFR